MGPWSRIDPPRHDFQVFGALGPETFQIEFPRHDFQVFEIFNIEPPRYDFQVFETLGPETSKMEPPRHDFQVFEARSSAEHSCLHSSLKGVQ